MKKKFYFILAIVASATIVSCTSDEYVGENPGTGSNDAITFGSGFKAVTRAGDLTGATAAEKLGNAFKIYGVKQDKTTTTNYNKVFVDYTVKYNTDQAGKADYNDGWYYVGAAANQYIKYWDYSSACYHFVAGSPVANFTYAVDGTTGDISTAAITGLGGRLNHTTTVASTLAPVYIAEPVNMPKPASGTKYGEVEFTFKSMQSKVRVGIYETIPGYKISSIKFYNNNDTPVESNYITLNSATADYFQGGSANVGGTVTYNWTTTPASYTFAYSGTGIQKVKYWEGGQFTAGVEATESTDAVAKLYGTETSKDANGYFTVMPTPSATAAAALTVKCNYELTSLDNSGEKINVTGATAAIPAAFCKWAPNTSYTYLFKISPNTNGSTGPDPSDPEGLFPITFDAVVKVEEDGTAQGIITAVSTPSITTYQEGSVTAEGIKYKYDSSSPKPIYFTAQNDETGALLTLTDGGTAVGAVQVYKLADAKTEADLQVSPPTGTDLFTLGGTAATVGKFSFEANKYGYFTPNATGYYAIQYLTKAASGSDPAAYTYKVVKVE